MGFSYEANVDHLGDSKLEKDQIVKQPFFETFRQGQMLDIGANTLFGISLT